MDVDKFINKCYESAKGNGWLEDCSNIEPARSKWLSDKMGLIAAEGAWMLEAMREDSYAPPQKYRDVISSYKSKNIINKEFKIHIKDSTEDRLAGMFMRTCELMGFYEGKLHCDVSQDLSIEEYIRTLRWLSLDMSVKLIIESFSDSFYTNGLNLLIDICLKIANKENIDLEWFVNARLQWGS